ncbi:Dimethylaniline monooxygenase [N-oxide-forming] 5 [Exaiptasia diaphana]|nr:Dimethylaniline monooxygenase [N-oxide-forming] 5 [Exaiptasia diaphana]
MLPCGVLFSIDNYNLFTSKICTMAAQPVYRDVVVIGAGWSGLMACKSMLEVGLSVIVLEKRENIGGLWCYTDDPEIVSVMKRTQCTSSSSITEFSDFPMPDEMGEFPTHSQILQYLNDYCAHFKLRQHICFGCDVKSADKMGDKWEVIVEEGTKYISKNLVLCTGANQSPRRELESTLFAEYTGEIMHSQTLKSFITTHKNKTVLIFGGGETAADIVEEWHDGGAKKNYLVYTPWSAFFQKVCQASPPSFSSDLGQGIIKSNKNSCSVYQGKTRIYSTKAEFLIFTGAIQSVKEKKVVFSDGSQADSVDVVIQCTGYYRRFPFLPTKYQVPMSNLYKFIFNVDDPSIAFVGYTRPIVGSIPILAELQAMYVARVFSGLVKLADNGALANETNQDKEFWCNYFKDSSHRLDTLVESYTYLDDLADKAGVSVRSY